MRKALFFLAATLVGVSVACAATCPLPGLGNVSAGCTIASSDTLVSWNLTDLQLSSSNPNVTPNQGAVSLTATVASDSNGDKIIITEQVDPSKWAVPAGSNSLLFLISYNLSATLNPLLGIPAPASMTSETQEYLNGSLYSTIVNGTVTLGPQPVNQINTSTDLSVQDHVILGSQINTPTSFTNTFEIPASELQTPPPAVVPEPSSCALMALAGVGMAVLYGRSKLIIR